MEIMPLGELKSLNELLEVMQHIVQHSSLQGELCRALEEHLSALSASFHSLFHHFFITFSSGSDVYGAAVVSCAVTTARQPCRLALARAILKEK